MVDLGQKHTVMKMKKKLDTFEVLIKTPYVYM